MNIKDHVNQQAEDWLSKEFYSIIFKKIEQLISCEQMFGLLHNGSECLWAQVLKVLRSSRLRVGSKILVLLLDS